MNDLYHQWLEQLIAMDGSDLHITTHAVPHVRVHGNIQPIPDTPVVEHKQMDNIARSLLGDAAFSELQATKEWDGAQTLSTGHRIRINAYCQQGNLALAIRLLPDHFFALDQLGLPLVVLEQICQLHSGLVLVTGATSSGKSTTIASIVNEINKTRPCHIHTIEDPVEYRHANIKAFVTQREVGRDTVSFAEALRRSMREDPDVVVIGEMRDLETMSAALTLAETGHLTLATLHTSDAVQTVSRIISAYPAAHQAQVRVQLASTLQVVLSQKLVPWVNGDGRSLAAEILVATPNLRAMIRDEKTHQMRTAMQTGGEHGMQTLNQSLLALLQRRKIDRITALEFSEEKANLIEELDHHTGPVPQRKGTR